MQIKIHSRTVKMATSKVLAIVTVFSIIPGGILSDIKGPRGLETQHLAQKSTYPQRRLKRSWIWTQLFVPEEDPSLGVIGQIKSGSDRGDLSIKYILTGEGAGDIFEIDEYSGEIRKLKKLDREEKAFYVLQAQAINRNTNEPEEPQSEFIVKVQDINDNVPQFQNEPYVSSIPEMSPAGIVVTSWPDLDRETRDEYLVVIQVQDMLGLSGGYSSSTTLTVILTDVNDNGPTFQRQLYTFNVPENAAIGSTVGRIIADDGDIGINARMTYSLEDDLEESSTFIIKTDPVTQEGQLLLAKPLDYESKRRYKMAVEAINDHVDTRFLPLEEFKDSTTIKIVVRDVDEPPAFVSPVYEWKVPENAAVGTVVGSISARDTDIHNSPIRYSIDKRSDATKSFRIDANNGTIAIVKALDRETSSWHNFTIEAKEETQNHLSSSVVVFIKVLDINDNVPRLARDYQPYICEGTQAGELIQLLSAVDVDNPEEGHHFYFSMVPEKHINPNFTIRDNQDNTAGIVTRRSTFTLKDRAHYFLPVVVADSGTPTLSSTSTLTISVCRCQPAGHCPTAGVESLLLSLDPGVKTVLGILVCLVTITVLSVLMLLLRRHKRKQQEGLDVGLKELELPDTVSQKVLHYGETGGRRVNFCQPAIPLHPQPRRRERRLRKEEVRASIRMSLGESHFIGPEDEVFRQFILDRLAEADQDPYAPPFDCLQTYAYEGSGSPTGSLSSLDSLTGETELVQPFYNPRVVKLSPWCGSGEEDTTF
uniref:Cadherin-12 n=1 Tax=Oryzias sinensis TaxID=183150 RepID=A0A8C7Z043_9TELE